MAGLGLVDSGFAGMRPWTRRECIRQVSEAEEKLGGPGGVTEAGKLLEALQREFRPEAEAVGDGSDGAAFRLESVYTRTEHISGAYDQRFFGLCDAWPVGFVCARRSTNRAEHSSVFPVNTRSRITGKFYSGLTTRNGAALGRPGKLARYLCRADVVELADFFRSAKLVVGNG